MKNSFGETISGAKYWPGAENQALTGRAPGEQIKDAVVDKLWPFTQKNLAPFAEQLEIYRDNPKQFAIDLLPVLRNKVTDKWEWNKPGLRRLGLLLGVASVVGVVVAACNGGEGNGTNPDNGNKDNCSWLTAATIGVASNMNDASSFIGVDSASFSNLSQLKADIQCFVPNAQVNTVFSDGVNSIVNILAPDEINEGSLRPVWGVVSGDVTDGSHQGKLLKLINVSQQDGLTVSRGDDNQLRVDLDSAVVSDSQKLGDGDVPSAHLEIQEGDSGEVTEVTLKLGDQDISMSRDVVGTQVGGAFVLGAVDAFKQQETELQLNSTRAGVSPDLSFATGIGVGIEGDSGESLSLNGDLQAAINSQGFIPVIGAGNLLNIHQEGKIGVCTTEVLADRDNPANVYKLVQFENDQWTVVHPGQPPQVNAEGLVAFGDDQGNPVEWMIAAVPNIFGSLEPVTLIVKDQGLISDSLRELGYEFLPGTVFTALIDPLTGEIQSLVPAIHKGKINMSQDGQGRLSISVTNGDTKNFTLEASAEAFLPSLPVELLSQFPESGNLFLSQFSDGGYEIRIDGVYAPDATGNMRLWYKKQADNTWEEVYFSYGGTLTEEKKIELANRLVCEKADTCISVGDRPGFANAFFEFISTGIVEKQQVIEPETGNLKGYYWDMLVVSKDINQQSISARIFLQVEFIDQLGINQNRGMAQSYSISMGWGPDGDKGKVVEVSAWQDDYAPEGRMMTIVIAESGSHSSRFYPYYLNLLGVAGDETHLNRGFDFATSRGIKNDSEFVLLSFGENNRMNK